MNGSTFVLTEALVGSKWLASHRSRFTPSTNCKGGRVEARALLDGVEKRKFLIVPVLELRPPGL
jgi:hypothetical protein